MIAQVKTYCLFVAILISSSAWCQQEKIRLPAHKVNVKIAYSIKCFIPRGYTLLDQSSGDLNNDGIGDKILVLRCEKEITQEEKRPLILLIGQNNHSYKKVAQNDNIVLSSGDGGIHGDPYHGISIKKGLFSIEHFGGSGWSWNQVITFKYNPLKRKWYLYKTGNEWWHIDAPNKVEGHYENAKNFGLISFMTYENKLRDNS